MNTILTYRIATLEEILANKGFNDGSLITIQLPMLSDILSIDVDKSTLNLYCHVYFFGTEMLMKEQKFRIIQSGEKNTDGGKYLGTVRMDYFTFHVFTACPD